MKIYNLLNTNKTFLGEAKQQTYNIQPIELVKLLNSTIQRHTGNKSVIYTNPEYLGQGINGDLFKVRDKGSGGEYICKVIGYNQAYLKQLKRELGLLKTIQNHPLIQEYINPCTNLFIRDNTIISLFPVFNGITLTNAITILNGSGFNSSNRLLLVKYIIKEILEAVFFFHKLNISHMQIDTESILIELREPNSDDLTRNTYISPYDNTLNNENIPISTRDKFIPTNIGIYDVEFTPEDKPLQIKFTNFGIGCGKLTEYDIVKGNNTERNTFQQCIDGKNIVTFDKDPYIRQYIKVLQTASENMNRIKNSKQLSVAKLYDIWLVGLVILQLILKPDAEINNQVKNNNLSSSDITGINASNLHDDSLELYLNILRKYILCPIDKRRNLKFVQEMIMLGEKHD